MRHVLITLLAATLVGAAGCVSLDAPPRSGVDDTPPGTAHGGPGASTGAPPPPPSRPPPQEIHTATHAFSAAPAADGTPRAVPFTLPEGFRVAAAIITFSPEAPLPYAVGDGIRIEMRNAAGTSLGSCVPAMPLFSPHDCTVDGGTSPGEHFLVFSGTGTLHATVRVMAS